MKTLPCLSLQMLLCLTAVQAQADPQTQQKQQALNGQTIRPSLTNAAITSRTAKVARQTSRSRI